MALSIYIKENIKYSATYTAHKLTVQFAWSQQHVGMDVTPQVFIPNIHIWSDLAEPPA